MNHTVTNKPESLFIKWAKSQGIDTSLADYNDYTGKGKGFVFNEYNANLFYQVFLRALANPKIDGFEEAVKPLEFNTERIKKKNQVLYKNNWTRKAYQLWEVICGKAEAIKEGHLELNQLTEVTNHE